MLTLSLAAVRRWLIAACGLLLLNTAAADWRDVQEEAAMRARAGDYPGALELLAELQASYPNVAALRHDEILIRAWAEDDAGVLQAASKLDRRVAPGSVLGLVAKAARNVRDYPQALGWYDAALLAAPDDTDLRLGLAMTLADADRHADARNALRGVPLAAQSSPRVLLASAYLFQREGFYLPALNEYDRILMQDPTNPEALRGRIDALQALLLPGEALRLAQQHPGLLTEGELERLDTDALGLRLRRAIQLPDQPYPYTEINAVLGAIDARLAELPPSSPAALRLRFDRIVGRNEALRTLEAIADYEELQAQGIAMPAFVHYGAGRAYAHRQRPEEALAALRLAAQLDPDDVEIQFELFYALIDLERHGEALTLIDALAARLDPIKQEPDSRVARPNETYTRARIVAGMGRAYADQLAEAQQQMEALLVAAPNNRDARYSLGNVYRYRGWRDRPVPEYRQVLAMSPDMLAARATMAQSHMDRQEFAVAQAQLRAIKPLQPGQRAVMDLNERWLLHRSWELRADLRFGESSGQTFGSDQHDVNLWLFTPPVQENFRLYARSFDTYADFVDGADARRRAAVGTEYRKGLWAARAEINGNRSGGGDTGFAARVDRRLNNEWAVGGTLEYDSYATPIRAERAGIRSDLALLDVSYSRDESYSAGAGVGLQDFTDGNQRTAAFANARVRLFNGIAWKTDGLVSTGISRNSRGGETPYFAPERDFEAMVGVANTWRQFRRFDRALVHRLTALGGTYNQRNFGSDAIWTLAYELNWSINESLGVAVGAQRARRVYDGNPEYQTFYNLRLEARF